MFQTLLFSALKHIFYTPKVKDLGKSNKHSCMFFIASPVFGDTLCLAYRDKIPYVSIVNCFRISIFAVAKTMIAKKLTDKVPL